MLGRTDTARHFVTLVSTYKTALRHNPEGHNLKMEGREIISTSKHIKPF
jgi:hypothetical protein